MEEKINPIDLIVGNLGQTTDDEPRDGDTVLTETLKELFSPIRTRLQLTIEDENPVFI